MNFKEYQEKALRTKGTYTDNCDQIVNGIMGLNGEAGEVTDLIKKSKFQGHELNPYMIKDELGDVLWYINLIADAFNINLEDVAKHNISKLENRYLKGYFRKEDSINREE